MGIEIPESLQWVAKYVVGAGDWPEGDETAMRRVESAWTQLATDLRDLDADANYAIDQVLASIEGDTAQAISDRWTQLGHGQGAFDGLIAHIETLADEIGDGAADIEQTKLVILASLAIFAVEMAVALAAASTGIGAPAAAAEAAAAQVTTRIAIRTAIKQLVQRILSKAALKAAARAAVRGAWDAALEETALDLGTKALQVATGRRDEITTEDLTDAGKAALTAAASGAVTGAMGPDGLTSRNVPGGPEGGNPLANAAKDAAKETVAGVAGEVAGEATDAALNDREFSWENALAPENLSSAAAGGLQRGGETLGESSSGDGPNNTGENDSGEPNESPDSGDRPGNDNEAPDSSRDQDTGDRETRNQSQQPTQPAGTNPPSSDTSTQTQPSSSGQQPPGQPTDTGSQSAQQQPSSQPGQDAPPAAAPGGSEHDSPPTDAPDSPQPTESGNGTPDSPQQAASDTATPDPQQSPPSTPDPQQAQPADSGTPDTPPETSDNGTSSAATDTPAESQPTPDTTGEPETAGTPGDSPASNPPPETGPEPPRRTSSLDLGPDSPAAPDTGTPSAATPESSTTPDTRTNADTPTGTTTSETSDGQENPPAQGVPGATTPGPQSTPSPPTTQSPSPDNSGPSRTDPGPTTTPGDPTTGETPPAGSPTTEVPRVANSTPATPPETSAAETTTTSAAATTPTVQAGPMAPPTPLGAPADTPRTYSASDTTAAPASAGANSPSGNPSRPPASGTARPTRDAAETTRDQDHTAPGTPPPDPTPNTPGYPYNLFDPANHARFLADFARPPIPSRTTPATDRAESADTGPHRPNDPSAPSDPSRADSPDGSRTPPVEPSAPSGTTDESARDSTPDQARPDSSRPPPIPSTDPIWNSPEQSRAASTDAGGRPDSVPPTDPAGPGPEPSGPANTRPTDPSSPGGPLQNSPARTPEPSDPGRSWWRPDQHRPNRSDSDIRAARAAREFYRNQPPPGNRVTPVRSSRNPHGRPAYRTTRHQLPNGETVQVLTVRVHPTLGPNVTSADIDRLIANTEHSIDRDLNTAPQLVSGDRVLVDVVFTPNPYDADVHISTSQDRSTAPNTWSVDSTPETITDNVRQQLGLDPVRPGSDPTLTPDDLRALSNDIARANTAPRFPNPSDSRVEGRGRLRPVENPAYQQMVEDSLRNGNRFVVGADPRSHPYGRLVNDGGPTVAGRGNNCLDCSLSALSSFYGDPQVSAPRWRDRQGLFRLDRVSGEVGGVERAAAWLGSPLQAHNPNVPVPQQFFDLHNHIAAMGPGSSALVVNSWSQGGSHATVVVYPYGAGGPVWWDPQSGQTSSFPPPAMVANSNQLYSIPVPPQQGVVNAPGAPVPYQQPSGPVPEGAVRPGGPVQPPGDGVRLGVPSDPDPAGDGGRSGPGPGELRGEQTDRGDHRTSQPAPGSDRPGVRPGDPGGPAGAGRPGISPDLDRADPGDPGNTDRYRVPGTSPVADQPTGGTPDRSSAADQQTNVPHGDQRAGDPPGVQRSGGLGGEPEPRDRDLAADRHLPVLEQPSRADIADTGSAPEPAEHTESSASEEARNTGPTHQRPTTDAGRSGDPVRPADTNAAGSDQARAPETAVSPGSPGPASAAPEHVGASTSADSSSHPASDHTAAPLAPAGTRELADLSRESTMVTDQNGLITSIDGRPVREHVDMMALDRANQYRVAAARNSPIGNESQGRAQARVRQMRADGTYVGTVSHGAVSAVVMDLRTGLVYEGVNGRDLDVVARDELHPTLQANIDAMVEAGRSLPGGGYPNLDRRGELDSEQPVRNYPHFDNPYGHAEVKAANELLWAREELNESLRERGLPELDTGPEALAEFYSQTYKPFNRGGPLATPYCANCDRTMGGSSNHSGRYTGFPPQEGNLVDVYAGPTEDAV
ncbi:toxin glutamine deamidase domain-containing protein [Nocardia sp. NPDC003963]